MGRYALNLSKEEMKVWTDLIDWLVTQDGFVLVGLKDGEVNAKASVDLEDAYEMISIVGEMLHHTLKEVDVVKVVQ